MEGWKEQRKEGWKEQRKEGKNGGREGGAQQRKKENSSKNQGKIRHFRQTKTEKLAPMAAR